MLLNSLLHPVLPTPGSDQCPSDLQGWLKAGLVLGLGVLIASCGDLIAAQLQTLSVTPGRQIPLKPAVSATPTALEMSMLIAAPEIGSFGCGVDLLSACSVPVGASVPLVLNYSHGREVQFSTLPNSEIPFPDQSEGQITRLFLFNQPGVYQIRAVVVGQMGQPSPPETVTVWVQE